MADSTPRRTGRRLVIALGGNAILPAGTRGTYEEQLEITTHTMDQVAALAGEGHQIVLTHGNGPIVGNIVLRNDAGLALHNIPPMPLHVCGADTQGGIGYMIQQALQNSLRARDLHRPVASVVTQVIVDRDDPAFRKPTKPIGPFYDAARAEALRREFGWTIVEDAGRGFRRVVPSPRPREVVEWEAIQALIEANVIAVAVGGGGVPVARDADGDLAGVDAVIDKDLASARLAAEVGVDTFIVATDVPGVAVGFGQQDQKFLARLTTGQARRYIDRGEFPEGSMLPKIRAVMNYLEAGGGRAVITSIEAIEDAVAGRAGTEIVRG